ncbi:hypothetical protein SCLCIDRAFT_1219179 [Scleroderma citrinum Foug A]|uniref:Uncharacterized protein n=1 Tax=Scleroderma citrinum Foug A TaxID=1036808 RepID=A0A0C3DNW4_9AGAM|nr:hypothetical protein SCLCIDRAFT_1219179 [Scleroderma citrinum Foug A]
MKVRMGEPKKFVVSSTLVSYHTKERKFWQQALHSNRFMCLVPLSASALPNQNARSEIEPPACI